MELIVEKKSLVPRFKSDSLYNEKTLSVFAREATVFTLKKFGEIVVEVPTIENSLGEYAFAGHYCFPYVDVNWFCNKVEDLVSLYELSLKDGKLLDILGILKTEGLEGFEDDNGNSLVKVTSREDRRDNYRRSMKKGINRMRNRTKGRLSYVPISLVDGDSILRYWFELHDNKFLKQIRALYQIWYDRKELLVHGIMLDGILVGVDYILLHEGLASGLLTPWKKDIEELYYMEVGHYAIDKALDILHELNIENFDIGERSMVYKRKWETSILETKAIGLGRWENRG